VQGGSGGPVGEIGEVGAGEDGSVASAVDDGLSMGGAWGEQRPGKSGYGARGGSGQPGPDCGDLGVMMGKGGRVWPSYVIPND